MAYLSQTDPVQNEILPVLRRLAFSVKVFTFKLDPDTNMAENAPKKPNKSYSAESVKVMSVAFELGFIIALPILVLALGGKWLDQRQHVGYYLYIGIALAIVLTSFWVYARFKDMVSKLEEAAKAGKSNTPNQPIETQKEENK